MPTGRSFGFSGDAEGTDNPVTITIDDSMSSDGHPLLRTSIHLM